MDRPDIYSDWERPEHGAKIALQLFHPEYECMRRPEFIHRTQGEARCNYWGDASYETGED